VSCGLSFGERRALLVARHGLPAQVPAAAALRLLGRRAEVHPNDAVAFAYRDQAAADAYAESNAQHQGIPSLGSRPVDGAIVGVLDLRPALARHARQAGRSWEFTDPGLPDDWHPR
jgi:hypothetical protein